MIGFHFRVAPEIGTGHARRCSVLALSLYELDKEIALFSDAATIIFSQQYMPDDCRFIKTGVNPATLQQAVEKYSLTMLIVDRYDLDEGMEKKLRDTVGKLVILDDFAGRFHDCDILLDQNHGRQPVEWANLQSKGTNVLVGSKYALLRDEFAVRRKLIRRQFGVNKGTLRVFICFGGVDILGLSFELVKVLVQAFGASVNFDVALGRDSLNIDKLDRLTKMVPSVRLHVDSNNIATLMAEASIAIGAPGSMTLERCCLYLPAILVSFSDNQIENGKMVEKSGVGRYLGDYGNVGPECIVQELKRLLKSPAKLQTMSDKAGCVTDGHGANRVAAALISDLKQYKY